MTNHSNAAATVKQLNKSESAAKPVVKINRNRKQITLIAKFTEPNESQLNAISQALFALIKK